VPERSADYYPEIDGTLFRMNVERTVKVWLPSVLRRCTGGESRVSVNASTVSETLDSLIEAHPDLRSHLLDEHGRLHSFVTIFRNDQNIRDLGFLEAEVDHGDELRILPAVAGG